MTSLEEPAAQAIIRALERGTVLLLIVVVAVGFQTIFTAVTSIFTNEYHFERRSH